MENEIEAENVDEQKTSSHREERLVMPLHGVIVAKVEEIAEIAGFDHAIVELRSGHVLEIGDCGLNVYQNRADFMDGIRMLGSIEFPRHNVKCPPTGATEKEVEK
jgi:hypothetical protein